MAAPRSFVGQKTAPVYDFVISFAESLGNSEATSWAAAVAVSGLLKEGLQPHGSPGVTDIGGLMKVQRTTFDRVLAQAKVDEAWADTWEELLDFTFPHPTKVSEENLPKKRKGGSLEPTFKKAKIIMTGESMLADGTLDGLVFTSDEFKLECSNPKDETVTTTDLDRGAMVFNPPFCNKGPEFGAQYRFARIPCGAWGGSPQPYRGASTPKSRLIGPPPPGLAPITGVTPCAHQRHGGATQPPDPMQPPVLSGCGYVLLIRLC